VNLTAFNVSELMKHFADAYHIDACYVGLFFFAIGLPVISSGCLLRKVQ